MAEVQGFEKSQLLILFLKISVLFNFGIVFLRSFKDIVILVIKGTLNFNANLVTLFSCQKSKNQKKVTTYDCEEH